MDALGLDVEETKGENLRGSGYWEAPRKRPDDACSADIPRWPYRYRTTAADKSILLVFHGRI